MPWTFVGYKSWTSAEEDLELPVVVEQHDTLSTYRLYGKDGTRWVYMPSGKAVDDPTELSRLKAIDSQSRILRGADEDTDDLYTTPWTNEQIRVFLGYDEPTP